MGELDRRFQLSNVVSPKKERLGASLTVLRPWFQHLQSGHTGTYPVAPLGCGGTKDSRVGRKNLEGQKCSGWDLKDRPRPLLLPLKSSCISVEGKGSVENGRQLSGRDPVSAQGRRDSWYVVFRAVFDLTQRHQRR